MCSDMASTLGVLVSFLLLALAGFAADAEVDPRPDLYFLDSKPASITEFPYQLSLNTGRTHVCGAAIIASYYALTSARCVYFSTPKALSLRAGSGSLLSSAAVYNLDRIYVHPKYNQSTHEYDIAVLKVNRPFVYNSTVRAIKVADQSPLPGSMAVITGWGYSSNTGPSFYYDLRQIKLPVVNQTVCQRYNTKNITGNMLCAGHLSGRPMPCGNAGLPLAYAGRLVGIASFAYGGCGRPGTLEVYARLSAPTIRSFIYTVARV